MTACANGLCQDGEHNGPARPPRVERFAPTAGDRYRQVGGVRGGTGNDCDQCTWAEPTYR